MIDAWMIDAAHRWLEFFVARQVHPKFVLRDGLLTPVGATPLERGLQWLREQGYMPWPE